MKFTNQLITYPHAGNTDSAENTPEGNAPAIVFTQSLRSAAAPARQRVLEVVAQLSDSDFIELHCQIRRFMARGNDASGDGTRTASTRHPILPLLIAHGLLRQAVMDTDLNREMKKRSQEVMKRDHEREERVSRAAWREISQGIDPSLPPAEKARLMEPRIREWEKRNQSHLAEMMYPILNHQVERRLRKDQLHPESPEADSLFTNLLQSWNGAAESKSHRTERARVGYDGRSGWHRVFPYFNPDELNRVGLRAGKPMTIFDRASHQANLTAPNSTYADSVFSGLQDSYARKPYVDEATGETKGSHWLHVSHPSMQDALGETGGSIGDNIADTGGGGSSMPDLDQYKTLESLKDFRDSTIDTLMRHMNVFDEKQLPADVVRTVDRAIETRASQIRKEQSNETFGNSFGPLASESYNMPDFLRDLQESHSRGREAISPERLEAWRAKAVSGREKLVPFALRHMDWPQTSLSPIQAADEVGAPVGHPSAALRNQGADFPFIPAPSFLKTGQPGGMRNMALTHSLAETHQPRTANGIWERAILSGFLASRDDYNFHRKYPYITGPDGKEKKKAVITRAQIRQWLPKEFALAAAREVQSGYSREMANAQSPDEQAKVKAHWSEVYADVMARAGQEQGCLDGTNPVEGSKALLTQLAQHDVALATPQNRAAVENAWAQRAGGVIARAEQGNLGRALDTSEVDIRTWEEKINVITRGAAYGHAKHELEEQGALSKGLPWHDLTPTDVRQIAERAHEAHFADSYRPVEVSGIAQLNGFPLHQEIPAERMQRLFGHEIQSLRQTARKAKNMWDPSKTDAENGEVEYIPGQRAYNGVYGDLSNHARNGKGGLLGKSHADWVYKQMSHHPHQWFPGITPHNPANVYNSLAVQPDHSLWNAVHSAGSPEIPMSPWPDQAQSHVEVPPVDTRAPGVPNSIPLSDGGGVMMLASQRRSKFTRISTSAR